MSSGTTFSVASASLIEGVPRVVLSPTGVGCIFMELYDKIGDNLLVGISYQITGGKPLQGTTGTDGRLRHDGVLAGDYVLSLQGYEMAAVVVLEAGAEEPQIRFLAQETA